MAETAYEKAGVLGAALEYAKQGVPVFPCNVDKSPATARGHLDATTNEDQIRCWWTNRPEELIGLRTGEKGDQGRPGGAGLFVLDVDGTEGQDTLAALEAENETLPETYEVRTRGGGKHLYFRHPGVRVKSTNGVIGPRLDVKGDGGYVIAPPSPGYEATSGALDHLAEAPAWLVEIVRGDRDTGRAKPLPERVVGGQRNTSLTSLAGSIVFLLERKPVKETAERVKGQEFKPSQADGLKQVDITPESQGCRYITVEFYEQAAELMEFNMEEVYASVYTNEELSQGVCNVQVSAFQELQDKYGQTFSRMVYVTSMDKATASKVGDWLMVEQPAIWTVNKMHPVVEAELAQNAVEHAADCAEDEGIFDMQPLECP